MKEILFPLILLSSFPILANAQNQGESDSVKILTSSITLNSTPPGVYDVSHRIRYLTKNLNKEVEICSKVKSVTKKDLQTRIDLDDGQVTLLIDEQVRKQFAADLKRYLRNKDVCVNGRVTSYQGKFVIAILDPRQLVLQTK